MSKYNEYCIAIHISGGQLGLPAVSAAFDRIGDIITYRAYIDKRQCGGGGHGIESAKIIEALLDKLVVVHDVDSESAQVADGSWIRLDVKYKNTGMHFEWFHDCPIEWQTAGELAEILIQWSRKYWS